MIDEKKIMQYADGSLPQEEHEEVKKAIETDPNLKKLYNTYKETGDLLFKLGNEIKSKPIPESLKEKISKFNDLDEAPKSSDKKKFILFRLPKIQYAAIAALFIVVLYSTFQTNSPVVVDKVLDDKINKQRFKASATLNFDILETLPSINDLNKGMLNTESFKKSYDDFINLLTIEKKIDDENSDNNFIKQIGTSIKAAFRKENAKAIYSKWKGSVVWITNPVSYVEDDKILGSGAFGTGSVIDNDGLILTNWHVVDQANQVWVYPFPKDKAKGLAMDKVTNAEKFLAKVIASSKKTDLALIKITGLPKRISPIPLGINDEVVPGEKVFALGHPIGFGWSITEGIVNQIRINEKWNYGSDPEEGEEFDHEATLVQSSANISSGNSGGPLFNEKGNMIGVNSIGFEEANNINLAVAVMHAKEIIENRENIDIKIKAEINPITQAKLKQKYPNLKTEDYDKNGIIDTWWVDVNNNGVLDGVYYERESNIKGEKEDGLIEIAEFDFNENKVVEVRLIDQDLDGIPNVKLINKDDIEYGAWSTIAIDIDQDGTFDHFQDF